MADRFCFRCGGGLERQPTEAGGLARKACSRCGEIHYENPKVLVSTLIECQVQLLLCRRAENPALGRWSLPGGFVESGETLEQAACREAYEETGVVVKPQQLRLHALSSLLRTNEVYVGFRTQVDSYDLVCGTECLDIAYFDEGNLPWDELAYPEIDRYLRIFFSEQTQGKQAIHMSAYLQEGIATQEYAIAGSVEKYFSAV